MLYLLTEEHRMGIMAGHETANDAVYFARTPAWRELGTTITEPDVTAEQALHMAKLDYEVKSAPLHALTDSGVIESPTHKMTYRDGPDGGPDIQLGIVGNGFTIHQPLDTFAWINELVHTGAVIDAAGALRNYRSIFISCRMPQHIVLDPDGLADEVAQYLIVRDAYDGNASFTGAITPTRVRCTNAVGFAMRNAKRTWRIQHRSGFEGHLQAAREALGISLAYTEAITPVFDAMARTAISDAQWSTVVEQLLAPDPLPRKGELEPSKAAVTRNDERREQLDAAYRDEYNAGVSDTVWGAFNAYTSWLDHGRPTRDSDALETAVLEDTYAADKGRVARELQAMFPAVERTARQLATA